MAKDDKSGKQGRGGAGNAAFMKPLKPDAALAAVVGSDPLPRTQVTKKLWAYIKKHDLQDTEDKRMINADKKLLAVFGGKKQVSMFEMTKLVSVHLTGGKKEAEKPAKKSKGSDEEE